MAPIKFEEHLKEKLDEREIQPSAGSWKKLDAKLDNSNKNPGRKWWISATAAIAILLIASLLFVNQQDQNSTPIVNQPIENEIKDNSEKTPFEESVQVASEERKEEVQPEVVKPEIQKPVDKILETEITGTKKTESLASNTKEERIFVEPISMIPPKMNQESNTQFSDKIQELLAKVSKKEKESGNITEAEVDALLAEAAREISEERNIDAQGKVSPDDLLAEAEEEIYQSFKDKIFEMVKTGYQKAAVAVSNKLDNNQNQ